MYRNKTEMTGTTAEKKVTVIPATKSLHPERDNVKPIREKIRVAAYCRVSTTQEEQQGSYELQYKYYEALIRNNPAWEFAGIYGDEGKSGTTLKGRTGFLQMMDDVRVGKIDYIITKATSRFGRNNAEFIEILDELESYGVEVLFESEGIVTSGQQNRTMLQMMGITNEHYSSTLSNNVRWSKERNMRQGKTTFCYKHFLGYEKGEDGEPRIVEEEAEVVRRIYELFMEGKSYTSIATYLTEQGVPTPGGKAKWGSGTIKSILTNEKYAGDALLQKTFKRNYLDKKAHVNDGERPKVLVENNHEAIIDKATFARVQELIKHRTKKRDSGTGKSPLAGKIICHDCGECFGHKTWTSRGRIKYSMWVCNHKYSEENSYGGDKCKTANLRQEWIEQGYLYTLNQILARRSEYLAKYGRKIKRITHRLQSGQIETDIKALELKARSVEEQIAIIRGESEFSFGRQAEFDERINEQRYQLEAIANEIEALRVERATLNHDKVILETFIKTLERMPEKQNVFNGTEFVRTIDRVEVSQFILTYHFYGGEYVKVNIELAKKMCK